MPAQSIWTKLSRQHAKNPGSIPLDALPVELLHQICSLLERGSKDIQNFRLACKTFAAVGIEHLLVELHTLFKRSHLDLLVEDSTRLVGKGVTSLFYEADRLQEMATFEAWNDERRQHEDMVSFSGIIDYELVAESGMTERVKRNMDRSRKKAAAEAKTRAQPSEKELQDAYARFKQYLEDEHRMIEEDADIKAFQTCFENCPKIDNIVVSLGNAVRIRTKVNKHAYKDAMGAQPYEDLPDRYGVRQLTSVLLASHRAKLNLKYLLAGEISHQFFNQSEEVMTEIGTAMQQLSWLDFQFHNPFAEETAGNPMPGIIPEEQERIRHTLSQGRLPRLLANCQAIRHLSISPTQCDVPELQTSITHLVGDNHFPHLEWIQLDGFSTTGDQLTNFLKRHKATLRTVYLYNVYLEDCTWESWFICFTKKMPKLRLIRLRGKFTAVGGATWYFGCTSMTRSTIESHAMDKFLRKGGLLPEFDDDYRFHIPEPMNHGQPGLGEDGRIDPPDSDYECDGISRRYEDEGWDSFYYEGEEESVWSD